MKNTNKNNVTLNLIQGLQRGLLSLRNSKRRRFQIKFGMTSLLNNGNAFTLIELLVVVLIIGILAAVAVPQYKKIVWKSRAAQIIPVVRALAEAEKRYFLANGTYTTNFDELDLKFTQNKGFDEKKTYWTLHLIDIRSAQHVIAEINRLGNPWFYIRYDLANNWLECMPEGDGGKDICKLFSKTEPYSCTGATYETYKCYRIQ